MTENKADKPVATEPRIDTFSDDDERRQAITDFNSLKVHPGWKRIEKYYKECAAYYQRQLNGEADMPEVESIADLKLLRYKRNAAEKMSEIPDILAGFLEMNQEDLNLDPFFLPEELEK